MELCIEDDACFMQDDQNKRNICWTRAAQLGATHIRVVVYLHYLNACNPSYTLYQTRYGTVVTEAISHGLNVQMVITGAAAGWGKPCAGQPPSGINPDPTAVAAFVNQWVQTYDQMGVRRFTIWNEPNYPAFLCAGSVTQKGGVDSAKCTASKKSSAALLRKIYTASYNTIQLLKTQGKVHQETQVFIGDTAGVDVKFMSYLFAGKKLVADGFGVHPYEYCQNPTTGKMYTGKGACKDKRKMTGITYVARVQAKLAALYKSKKFTTPTGGQVPMWLTEFGYWRTTTVGLGENVRAQFYPKALDMALKSGAGGMNLYQLWQSPPGNWDTSILNINGTALPSFYAIRKWAKKNGYNVAAV